MGPTLKPHHVQMSDPANSFSSFFLSSPIHAASSLCLGYSSLLSSLIFFCLNWFWPSTVRSIALSLGFLSHHPFVPLSLMPHSLFATLGSRSSGGRGCGVAVGMDVGREQNLIRAMVGLGIVNFLWVWVLVLWIFFWVWVLWIYWVCHLFIVMKVCFQFWFAVWVWCKVLVNKTF